MRVVVLAWASGTAAGPGGAAPPLLLPSDATWEEGPVVALSLWGDDLQCQQ